MTDAQIFEFFQSIRWADPAQIKCPQCSAIGKHPFKSKRQIWRCRVCEYEFGIFTGTVFHRRKLSLRVILLLGLAFVTSAKGAAAILMSRLIGMTPPNAWTNLMKFREAIARSEDKNIQLSGVVHVDAGFFCGRRRDANKHNRRAHADYPEAVRAKLTQPATLRQKRFNQLQPGGQHAARKKKNVRVAMTFRQVSDAKGVGAVKTKTVVLMSENATDATRLVRKYLMPGTMIQSDMGGAYSSLGHSGEYGHRTVNHSVEYQSDAGVNNNQAESYFSRLRRAQYGVHHRFTPKYFALYVAEFTWREDMKAVSNAEKLQNLFQKVFSGGQSESFRRVKQGCRRQTDYPSESD